MVLYRMQSFATCFLHSPLFLRFRYQLFSTRGLHLDCGTQKMIWVLISHFSQGWDIYVTLFSYTEEELSLYISGCFKLSSGAQFSTGTWWKKADLVVTCSSSSFWPLYNVPFESILTLTYVFSYGGRWVVCSSSDIVTVNDFAVTILYRSLGTH